MVKGVVQEGRRIATTKQVVVAFVISGVIASGAAWVGWRAGQDSDHDIAVSTWRSDLNGCNNGGDFRIAIAKSMDELRRTAVGLPADAPARNGHLEPRDERFLKITQEAIDRLLTQAAGKPYRAPHPPGAVTERVITEVRALSEVRCQQRFPHPDAQPDP